MILSRIKKTKPWLLLPTSVAHSLAPFFVRLSGNLRSNKTYSWNSLEWRGLTFANRLGVAAGVDKDASQVRGWWSFGAGFLEVGTIVPQPQGPNTGPILDRDKKNFALWNRMGFPSKGVETFKDNLLDLGEAYHTPLFINIGKNRETPLGSAHNDYVKLIHELNLFADAFVVNISSPNTQNLRSLLTPAYLESFLGPIVENRDQLGKTPLLLKISPDLTDQELQFILECSLKMNLDGWVLANTTTFRPPEIRFPREGGLSGKPLATLSKSILSKTLSILGSQKKDRLVVSVGGVMSPEDVMERLEMGADLVEVYTALVFEGPQFFKNSAKYALFQP